MPPTSEPETETDYPVILGQWDEFVRGIEQFNAGACFEAHETLEALWMLASGSEKCLLQGLIQLAVACHHWQRGNFKGAASLLAKAEQKLILIQAGFLETGLLLADLEFARQELQTRQAAGPGPPLKIVLKKRFIP